MAARFTHREVLAATGANPIGASPEAVFAQVCTDSRAIEPGSLFVALIGERFDAHTFLAQAAAAGAKGAVVKAGQARAEVPAGFGLYEVADTLAALGGLALHHRHRFHVPLGAVGGSNGKTTTKEMVAAILATRGNALATQGNLNNEVGAPLTLFRLDESHVAGVVELGMNHPGEMTRLCRLADPDAAVITVVQPEHLEGLGSLEGVARAEAELFVALRPDATAVVNLDDPRIVEQAKGLSCQTITFGKDPAAQVRLQSVQSLGRDGQALVVREGETETKVRIGFVGAHNAHNAAAAFALCRALGFSPSECAKGLSAAKPYARRLNLVDAPGGVLVVDDCYNANPASMLAALETLETLRGSGRSVAVLGDMLELGPGELAEHEALGREAGKRLSLCAFFGPRSQSGFAAANLGNRAAHFEDPAALLSWLRPQLRQGDVVLVKGSRGMRLERVVEGLTGRAAGGGHG